MQQILLVIAVLTAVGLPWAAPRRGGRRSSWVELGFESFAAGVCAVILSGILLARVGWFDRAVLVTLAIGALGYGLRLADGRGWQFPDRPSPIAACCTLGVLSLSLYLRRAPSDYLFHTADMGEYVNQANLSSRTGEINESFLHGFIALLGWSHQLLGAEWTEIIVPAVGIGAIGGLVAILQRLGTPAWAQAAVAVLASVQVQMVWFSLITVSETLFLLLLVVSLHQIVRGGREPLSVVSGIAVGATLGFALMATRANAMLLVPAMVVGTALGATASRAARRVGPLALATGAAAGAALAYAYAVQFNGRYFVEHQLRVSFPSLVYDWMVRSQLAELGPVLAAVLAAATGGVAVGLYLIATRAPVVPRIAIAASVAIFGVAVISAAVLHVMAPWVHFGRWTWAVLLPATIGVVSLIRAAARGDDEEALITPVMLVVGAAFLALQAKRLDTAIPYPPVLLYWDRYLYSELLALALVAVGVGITSMAALGSRLLASRPHARTIAAASTCGLLVALTLPTAPLVRNLQSERLYGDTYATLDAIDAATREGAGEPPALALSVDGFDDRWTFGRVHRSLALPLIQSFGRRFPGLDLNPAAPDPSLSLEDGNLVGEGGEPMEPDARFVVDVRFCGQQPCSEDSEARLDLPLVESIDYRVPNFPHSEGWRTEDFTDIWLRIDVLALSRDDST
jgi:hypothetical protein